MKKAITLLLVLVLTLSFTSLAAAATTSGKATAPGQADNFSKGITTEVTVSEIVPTPHVTTETNTATEIRLVSSNIVSVTGTPVITTFVDKSNVVGYVEHTHFTGYFAPLYSKTTTTVTPISNTQVSTYASYNVTYTRTVSTYYKIKRTVMHYGAPGSNGKVISDVSEEVVDHIVYGAWVEQSATEITGTQYTVTTKLADTDTTVTEYSTVQGGYALGKQW
jgi:hypothetical protein